MRVFPFPLFLSFQARVLLLVPLETICKMRVALRALELLIVSILVLRIADSILLPTLDKQFT